MGKGRAPCCDKSKVKKGPWSPAEDLRLISFIQKNGHPNWRALPKQAGLLRCGKSCRLRWINYLRPDVKRGNFTPQEEETIIKLHNSLGNKWSKIAAHFPGRTDNEIKNVWNTHLKKRLMNKKDTTKISTNNETIINSNNIPTIEDASSQGSPTSCSSSSASSSTSKDDQVTTPEVPPPESSSISGHHDAAIDLSEIWDMLDTLDPSPQCNEMLPDGPQLGSSLGGEIVDKEVEWLRYLENELGLEDSPNNYAQPQKDDSNYNLALSDGFDDFGTATSLYFPTWPPCSP